MPQPDQRHSPDGRSIRILEEQQRSEPGWRLRRRRAYRAIDTLAVHAKRVVQRWLVPRPASPRLDVS